MIIVQVLVYLYFASAVVAEEKPEFEITPGMKLEQKMIAERLKIKSGRVVVLYLDYMPIGRNEDEEYPQKKRTIYESDGVNSRVEYPDRHAHGYAYNEVFISTEKESIRVTPYKNRLFINRAELASESTWRRIGESFSCWGPTLYGSNYYYRVIEKICSHSNPLPLEDRIANPDRFNEKITDETLNGISVKHVSYELPKGKHVEYWIAPGQGYSLLKMISKSTIRKIMGTMKGIKKQNVEMTVTYEYEWKQYPSGLWFPAKWKDVTTVNDIVTQDTEHVIEQADFTTPIPPERFSIQKLINTKKKIINYKGHLRYTPDGIITDEEYLDYLYKIGGPPPGVEENNSKKWGKPFVAVILVLLAIVLLNQRRKNKWKA